MNHFIVGTVPQRLRRFDRTWPSPWRLLLICWISIWGSSSDRARSRCHRGSQITTTSPLTNWPSAAATPIANRLLPWDTNRAACAGIQVSRPRGCAEKPIQRFQGLIDLPCAGNSVPTTWPCQDLADHRGAMSAGDDHVLTRGGHNPGRLPVCWPCRPSSGPWRRRGRRLGSSRPSCMTVGISADRASLGSPSYSPWTSDRMTSNGARNRLVTMAARRSLSPKVVINSSTATVSFSLITGMASKRSSASKRVADVQVAGAVVQVVGGEQQLGGMASMASEKCDHRPRSTWFVRRPRLPAAGPGRWAAWCRPSAFIPAPTAPELTRTTRRPESFTLLICSANSAILSSFSTPFSCVNDASAHLDHNHVCGGRDFLPEQIGHGLGTTRVKGGSKLTLAIFSVVHNRGSPAGDSGPRRELEGRRYLTDC